MMYQRRLDVLKFQDDLVHQVLDETRQRLGEITNDVEKYSELIKNLILQGLYQVFETPVVIKIRKVDKDLIEALLPDVEHTYEEASKKTVEIKIDNENYLPDNSSGGVEILIMDARIKINNTLESRLENVFAQLIPQIRIGLFGPNLNRNKQCQINQLFAHLQSCVNSLEEGKEFIKKASSEPTKKIHNEMFKILRNELFAGKETYLQTYTKLQGSPELENFPAIKTFHSDVRATVAIINVILKENCSITNLSSTDLNDQGKTLPPFAGRRTRELIIKRTGLRIVYFDQLLKGEYGHELATVAKLTIVGGVTETNKQSWIETACATIIKTRDRAQTTDIPYLKLRVLGKELVLVRNITEFAFRDSQVKFVIMQSGSDEQKAAEADLHCT
ncbi:hypothetical protein RN001_009486 [Aquatica leii]|uniref:Uncharacterized protein n=1 Tax=Aquatica leii TaxID=1421715 RepID=A0AAN7Q2I2_9COLE|nr:hypothetical protein RN001_009486 [Aquatica leii]